MSESSNQTSTNTYQVDNRRVIGQGGISAENSHVSIVTNTLDGGAISGAFGFGRGIASDAFGFGAEALNANNATTAAALRGMGNVTDAAIGAADSAQRSVLAGARYAMDANQAVFDAAFQQTGRAFTQAYDAVAGAGNMVANAYADAKGRGAKTDTMLMLAVAAMGVVALSAVAK